MVSRFRLLIQTTRKVIFIFLILLGAACGKPAGPEKSMTPPTDPGPYLGTYALLPSYKNVRLTLHRDFSVTYSERGVRKQRGSFMIDQGALRIFLTLKMEELGTAPRGVFLLKAYKESGWRGFWNDETRSLRKIKTAQNSTSPES